MEPTLGNILLILLILGSINYLGQIIMQRMNTKKADDVEGFTDAGGANEVYIKNNDDIYDDFYASVYDKLTQDSVRTQAKAALLMAEWKGKGAVPSEMVILDAGAGTGVGATYFAGFDVNKVIALDKSQAMLNRAKNKTIPQAKITPQQKQTIELRHADLLNPSALGGATATHAAALYFTIYYLNDIDAFFRNMFLWIKPGGSLAVEVVNKYKFDPMLDSASPWVGFSLQKYSKERVTESKVAFNTFDYTGKFDLFDPKAEFRETFRFKDGKVRRQKHSVNMPSITQIVTSAQAAGWKYTKFIDLTPIGFEYAFLLIFYHP